METRVLLTYPAGNHRLVVRTEVDWERDVEPVEVSADGTRTEFALESDSDLLQCKPCLYRGEELHPAPGTNYFVPIGVGVPFEGYPHHFTGDTGRVTELVEIESSLGRPRQVHGYLPARYDENVLARYPVIYMQDRANLFLPEEASSPLSLIRLASLADLSRRERPSADRCRVHA